MSQTQEGMVITCDRHAHHSASAIAVKGSPRVSKPKRHRLTNRSVPAGVAEHHSVKISVLGMKIKTPSHDAMTECPDHLDALIGVGEVWGTIAYRQGRRIHVRNIYGSMVGVCLAATEPFLWCLVAGSSWLFLFLEDKLR